jgi:glycosyltransferase involved in cell wall biosynthesis
MDRVFEMADVLALHLRDDALFHHTIPSKLQHYISIGRPILAGIAGEGRELLEESGAAWVFAPMNVGAARDAMLEISKLTDTDKEKIRENSTYFYRKKLSFEGAIQNTLDVIEISVRP